MAAIPGAWPAGEVYPPKDSTITLSHDVPKHIQVLTWVAFGLGQNVQADYLMLQSLALLFHTRVQHL